MTYGEILCKVRTQCPEIMIDDYRPADGLPNTLIIWASNGERLLVNYQKSFDAVFILSRTPQKGGE